MVAPHSLIGLVFLEGRILSRGLETSHSLVVPFSVTGPYLLHAVHGRLLSFSIPPLAFHIPYLSCFFFFPSVSMVKFYQPCRAHVRQHSQFSKWNWVLLVLLGKGSPVPLLLDNPVPVSVIVHPIDETLLGQMDGSVSVAGLSVELSGSRNLLWGGCWFGLR